jgi:hypothetical protein
MKRKKREVWVSRMARDGKFRIVDANTGAQYQGKDIDGKPLFECRETLSKWPTRESAEEYAQEQGFRIV